jgi:hypothetical protein
MGSHPPSLIRGAALVLLVLMRPPLHWRTLTVNEETMKKSSANRADQQAVLNALKEFADDSDKHPTATVEELAAWTGLSEKAVIDAVLSLEAEGLLPSQVARRLNPKTS